MSEEHAPGTVRLSLSGNNGYLFSSERVATILTIPLVSSDPDEAAANPGEAAANGEFILRAWKTHADLLAACEAALLILEDAQVSPGRMLIGSGAVMLQLCAIIVKAAPPEEPKAEAVPDALDVLLEFKKVVGRMVQGHMGHTGMTLDEYDALMVRADAVLAEADKSDGDGE